MHTVNKMLPHAGQKNEIVICQNHEQLLQNYTEAGMGGRLRP
jgi:hypothetical protein